jgi:hypothetical protein
MQATSQRGVHPGALVFAGCAVAGALIWVASPWLTGKREPWDAQGFFYLGSLVAVGLVSGVVAPRRYFATWGGAYVGQFVGTLLSGPIGSLAPLGWFVVLPFTCLIVLSAAVAGTIARYVVTALVREASSSSEQG